MYYGELENRELQLTIATSFPGSPLSRWRGGDPGTTPGTHRYATREILHESWRISFSLHLISGSRNQKWLKMSEDLQCDFILRVLASK